MANNYIIYPYADKSDWNDTTVIATNQGAVSGGEIVTAYQSDSWTGSWGSFPSFSFVENSAYTTSTWVILKYGYVDATTTGLSNAVGIHNELISSYGSTTLSASLSNGSLTTLNGISNVEVIHVSANNSAVSGTTSGYTYGDSDADVDNPNESSSSGGSGQTEGISWYSQEPEFRDNWFDTLRPPVKFGDNFAPKNNYYDNYIFALPALPEASGVWKQDVIDTITDPVTKHLISVMSQPEWNEFKKGLTLS